jgi:NTP pyrophosphatase (non-canonical NTP hydrolase)
MEKIIMTPEEYQQKVVENITNHEGVLQCLTLGLGEETGEVIGAITKLWRYHDKTELKDIDVEEQKHLLQELGDILWYVTALANHLGSDLSSLMEHNQAKLSFRRWVKVLAQIFKDKFPDCNDDYADVYWERIRKAKFSTTPSKGLVEYSFFPDGCTGIPGVQSFWVDPVEAATLGFLLQESLKFSDIWFDFALRKNHESYHK